MSRKTRKLMWSVPLIAAVAVIGALAAFMTLQPGETEAQTLAAPGQVQNVMLESTGPTSLKLTWDAPTDGGRPTAYRIDVSDDGLTWQLEDGSLPAQATEYEDTGLSARETKYYRIFAHNTSGTKIGPVAFPTPAMAVTDASTTPEDPDDVTATRGTAVNPPSSATDATRTMITLRWDEPDEPDGTSIVEYKIAYAINPADLSLDDQVQSLTVVNNIDEADDDHVYCGFTAGNDGLDCQYTFDGLLEHQTWHFQIYAVNEDAMGTVGTGDASDSKSATTDDGVLPAPPTDLWASVNRSENDIRIYWEVPDDPAGAPVNGYLIQGRPMTDIDGSVHDPVSTDTDVMWGNESDNAIILHAATTSDLLLTDHAVELRRAARVAWNKDANTKTDGDDMTMSDLEGHVGDFETYFANLQWEFRVFALNRVWERTVKDVPTVYDAALSPTGAQPNMSDSIHVSLNDLDIVQQTTTIQPTVDVSDAPAGFSGLTINSVTIKNVAVTDEPGVYISDTSLAVTEAAGGGDANTATYMVVLTRAPTADVTVTIASDNTDVSASTLSAFTTANWWIGQTVTVTAAEEGADADNDTATLTHTVASADTTYAGIDVADVTVTVTDDDTTDGTTVTPGEAPTPVPVRTPSLEITPSMVVYARPSRMDAAPTPAVATNQTFTVELEEVDEDTTVDPNVDAVQLGTNEQIVVMVKIPGGYTLVDTNNAPLDATGTVIAPGADTAQATSQTITFTDEGTSTFILRPDGDDLVIAPSSVYLQMPPGDLEAMKDQDTDGGRTKIDLEWERTYSHDPTPDGSATDDDKVYATHYRVRWSTDPDASDWTLLTPDMADADICNMSTGKCMYSHTGRKAGVEYTYEVFAKNAPATIEPTTVNGEAYSLPVRASATTTNAEKPGRPMNVEAKTSQRTPTEIILEWERPARDADGGGDGDGFGEIIKYEIEVSENDSDSWEALATVTVKAACDGNDCSYTHEGLLPGQTRRYRVLTINKGVPELKSDWSDTATATTPVAKAPDKPEGLVAEAMGATMINLMWNVQSRTPDAAPIVAYIIEYDMDGEWMEVARIMDSDDADNMNGMVRTIYTNYGLAPLTERTYRVLAQNMTAADTYSVSPESDNVTAMTDDAMAPDAPTGVTATADSDMAITVSWTAPADPAGAPVTGFIIERKYGDMMFLDHEDAMGDAFTDAQTWWDGLGCEAMVAAVMDDRTADSDNPFCKMYAGLAEADKMTVDEYFMKRYAVVGDVTSYEDTGLMAETEYTYRVKAVNAKGAGEWSDEKSATTEAMAPAELMAPSGVMASHDGVQVTVTWEGGENADTFYVAMIRRDANDEWDIPNAVFDHAPTGTPFMVNMSERPAGTYHVFVVGGRDGTEWTNWAPAATPLDYQP